MKYVGSKARIAKDILPIILANRKPNQWYIEPFCGGCNTLALVPGPRIGNDVHPYLVSFWRKYCTDTFTPPDFLSENDYNHIKNNKESYESALVGCVGFNSYGGKWFGGWCRDKEGKRNYWDEHKRNIEKQKELLCGCFFFNAPYDGFIIPPRSIVYCDPPYANALSYKSTEFSTIRFWDWVRSLASDGHQVFVSEYTAPSDFTCVWEKELHNTLVQKTGSKRGIERLFVPCEKGNSR